MSPAGADCKVLVFAKAPLPGKVKSRLIPVLGAERAALLHCRLTEQALTTALAADLGPVELWCAPDTHHPFFRACRGKFGVTLHEQAHGDLGVRMLGAAQQTLASFKQMLLVGADCPLLQAEDLREAGRALVSGNDAVLGPAEDGGYVLLGLCRSDPALFRDIEWGTCKVLDATRARLGALGWRWHELHSHWDIDRPEDYRRMLESHCLSGWEAADAEDNFIAGS